MALDFPAAPVVGQKYPSPSQLGVPTYVWDGVKWTTVLVPTTGAFPAGTVLPFFMAAPPVGWTKLTNQNDKALRVVSGAGGVAGGTNPFSSVMAQTVVGNNTDTIATMPAHTHAITASGTVYSGIYAAAGSNYGHADRDTSAANNGGNSPHNHTVMMAIQYIDVILASKD